MKATNNKYRNGVKRLERIGYMIVIVFFGIGCNKDDGTEIEHIVPIEEQTIFGKWRAQEDVLGYENTKYAIINDDYSISVLTEDELGFRSIYSDFEVTSNEEIANSFRFAVAEEYRYTLEGNKLTIVSNEDGSRVTLDRDTEGPGTNIWVKTLGLVNQQDAPWDRNVDIGYNGSMILFPNGAEDQNLGLVNSSTLGQEGILATDIHSYPVEAEKSRGADQHYFQVESGSTIITAYLVPGDETNPVFYSQRLGATNDFGLAGQATIRGLAVTEDKTIWASNQFEQKLYLYKYTGAGQIMDQVQLNISPHGLDFQNGYLYVSDGRFLHKCQTISGFRVVESYKVPGHKIYGVAYDGANFILNTQKLPDDNEFILAGRETDNKLLKVDLSN